ncbi:MAG: hypothetical protein MI976_30155 [Pseudomonadales bacterium]|nr:hypothetical protein [Pseudomonadales bacterium]
MLLKTLTTLTVLFAMTVLSGCGATSIFKDDFSADAIGSPPAQFPAGNPAGDEIYMSDSGLSGSFEIVHNAFFSASGGNSLRYSNLSVPLYHRYLGLMSTTSTIPSDGRIRAIISGRPSLSNSGSGLQIWLGNTHFGSMCSVRLKNGNLYRQNSFGSYVLMGSYSNNTNHLLTFNVDKETGTCQISTTQNGTTTNSGSFAMQNPSIADTSRPTLYYFYYEDLSGSGTYFINSTTISYTVPE